MKKMVLTAALTTAILSTSTAFAGGSDSIFSDTSGGGATTSGFYGGASAGLTLNDNCPTATYSDNTSTDNITCKRKSDKAAWKAFGGYKVAPNLAIEGAYIDFGEYSNQYDQGTWWGKDKATAKGVSLMGVASTSVSDSIDVFGKLGVLHWKRDAWSVTSDSTQTSPDVTATDTGNDLAIGAGASINVSDNIAIRGEVEHFNDLDVNLVSLGASFSSF